MSLDLGEEINEQIGFPLHVWWKRPVGVCGFADGLGVTGHQSTSPLVPRFF